MVKTLLIYVQFMCTYGTHPIYDSISDRTGIIAMNTAAWIVHGVESMTLWLITLTKYLVEDW